MKKFLVLAALVVSTGYSQNVDKSCPTVISNADDLAKIGFCLDRQPTGYLDRVDCDHVSGWSNLPQVDVYDGDVYIGSAYANIYRQDVGDHAYQFVIPEFLKDGKSHYIWVRAGGKQLKYEGPHAFKCMSALIYYNGSVSKPIWFDQNTKWEKVQ